MFAQMMELLLFAGVAFFVINRLIAILGSTSEDDPAKQKSSFFGEASLKDVTHSSNKNPNIIKNLSTYINNKKIDIKSLDGLIVSENSEDILKGLNIIASRIKSFNPSKFLNSAKMAFTMVIQSANNNNINELSTLVDKKYIDKLQLLAQEYGEITDNDNLIAHISEAYVFANNVIIKILFTGTDVTSKIKNLNEEWSFNKHLMSNQLIDWLLTDIDKIENNQDYILLLSGMLKKHFLGAIKKISSYFTDLNSNVFSQQLLSSTKLYISLSFVINSYNKMP